jgi:hypothetical protein
MIGAMRGSTFTLLFPVGLVSAFSGLRLLLFPISLFLALNGPAAFATTDDCVEDDPLNGRFICRNALPDPIGINPCDEAASFVARSAAWCAAGGGTSFNNVTGACPGFTRTSRGIRTSRASPP